MTVLIGRLQRGSAAPGYRAIFCALRMSASFSLKVSPGCICLKGYFLLIVGLLILSRRSQCQKSLIPNLFLLRIYLIEQFIESRVSHRENVTRF